MTGIILAGGENKRIPVLKGHIEINGQRIIDSGINLLKNFFDRVIISTNTPELYFYCGVPMIGDIIKQRGPIAGIFSVLSNTGDDIFVTACDMPFIKPELVSLLVARCALHEENWDAVIPVFEGRPQPLLGIYSKNILSVIEERLRKELRSLKDMLTELKVLYIKEEEVRETDPEGRSFVNINTMEDFKKAVSY
ncbi:MAG: molybdopterin-guanine dinucleotide biosynthesis protein A [Nitrospirae bacterium]|nr:MAG: molybdopterin-guanine dinucleotide biosynthesis protein A [Nitrospirota bacterium]